MHDAELARFLEALKRHEEAGEEAGQVLAEAEELYAPAAAGARLSLPDATTNRSWTFPAADRWVTYPLWVAWVTATHLAVGLATVLALLFATALLALLGRLIDSVVGLPLATTGAVGVGLLASVGTLRSVYAAWRDRLREFPW